MKRKHMVPVVLAVLAILMGLYGLLSYGWYLEERVTSLPDDGGNIKTELDYGIRGVANHTRHMQNGTMLDQKDTVHTYDEFLGEGNMAGPVAARMTTIMLIGIIMAVLFIPLALMSQTGGLDDLVGKWGSYLPLYTAQVSAITLILAPIWFSYEFITGLDMDMMEATRAPSQALGQLTGWWVIFAGVLIQIAAVMALSRTRLIYIEPLDETNTPEASD